MKPRCDLAFLSAAHIHTRDFLENIARANDGRRAALVWDDNVERGQRYAQQCGARFEPDLEKAIAEAEIDGFVICAENTRRFPLLEKVLPLGKPILSEKPLVTSRGDLARLGELCERFRTPLFCGYFQPFSGEMQAVAKILAEGQLGKVLRARCRNSHFGAFGGWFDNPDLAWFTQAELAGGGGFADMGTHAIHLVRTLFGPVEKVSAVIENQTGIYPEVDDFGQATLRMSSGVLCNIEGGWAQSSGVIRAFEIVGSEKTLWREGNDLVMAARMETPELVVPIAAAPDRIDRLVAMIRNEIPRVELRRDLEATFDAVKIMSACYESARSGNWTQV